MKEILRRFMTILLVTLVLTGCASLPSLKPLDPAMKNEVEEVCRRPFLSSRYRLVHAIDTVLPDGKKGTAIGIMVADPLTRQFQTALMTLEGFVLFSAESGEKLMVSRAVPPFDSTEFARSLEEDIRLAFFLPEKEPLAWGREESSGKACRFKRPDGGFVDISASDSGPMEIRLYGEGGELRKRVTIPSFNRDGLADRIKIQRSVWPPYTLNLRLIESEVLTALPPP